MSWVQVGVAAETLFKDLFDLMSPKLDVTRPSRVIVVSNPTQPSPYKDLFDLIDKRHTLCNCPTCGAERQVLKCAACGAVSPPGGWKVRQI